MIRKLILSAGLISAALLFDSIAIALTAPKVIYTLDFGQPENSDASEWLAEQGFEKLLDADKLSLKFGGGGMTVSTNGSVAGIFALKFPKHLNP